MPKPARHMAGTRMVLISIVLPARALDLSLHGL
jgi:hypothetical protein